MLRPREPPRWLWLWVPTILFSVLLLLAVRDDTDPAYTRRWWAHALTPYAEYDFVEQATAVAAALAVVAGIAALRHRYRLPTRWIRGWVALVTVACFYIAGEEVTWGQYCFGWCWGYYSWWDAPAWWPTNHTNLHSLTEVGWDPANSESAVVELATWFNHKPRLVLEMFVLYGGIVRVLVRARTRGTACPALSDWFWPTYVCLPSALLAILARTPARMDALGFGYAPLIFDPGLLNFQSFQEMFFSLFLLIYLLSVWYRVTDGTDRAPTVTSGSRQLEPSP